MPDFRRLTLLAALALGIAACGTSSATASHGALPTASLAPAATSPATTSPGTAGPSGTSAAAGPSGTSAAGQTDTEWGRIWDALPTGFPTFPGSTPSEEASTGPASATLAVDGNVAKAVATTFESKLKAAGYSTETVAGPLEDGTYTLEMTGSAPGCRIKVLAQPTGGLTTVTILYGAACPFG
jgi:hypothetical protein